MKFFAGGILFEVFLIVLFFLPREWVPVEGRNFVILVHMPLFVALDALRGPMASVLMVAGLAVMAYFWGLLFAMISRVSGQIFGCLGQRVKRLVILLALVGAVAGF